MYFGQVEHEWAAQLKIGDEVAISRDRDVTFEKITGETKTLWRVGKLAFVKATGDEYGHKFYGRNLRQPTQLFRDYARRRAVESEYRYAIDSLRRGNPLDTEGMQEIIKVIQTVLERNQ